MTTEGAPECGGALCCGPEAYRPVAAEGSRDIASTLAAISSTKPGTTNWMPA